MDDMWGVAFGWVLGLSLTLLEVGGEAVYVGSVLVHIVNMALLLCPRLQ